MLNRLLVILGSKTSRFVMLIFVFQIIATGGILTFVNISSERTLRSEQQALVSELRDDLLAGYRAGGEGQLMKLIDQRVGPGNDNAAILLIGTDGKAKAGNLAAWPTIISKSISWQALDLYRTGRNRPEHIGFMATALPDGSHLLTGHVIDSGLILKRINEEAMFAAFLVAIPLTLVIALVLARIIAHSMNLIATVTRAVGDGDLSRRVPLDGSGDSFDRLGMGVNILLGRIEALISELRIVTDGLAHDLRSPITRLKSALERAVIETDDSVALAALEKVSVEAETLLGMLTTALQISRAEAGIGRDRFAETDLRTLITDLVEIYGPLAEDKGFALCADVPANISVFINRELISQALGNLIENALKYAWGGTNICISATEVPGGVKCIVSDDGPGIPPDRRTEAMRRFGRLDPARQISGSGLGLSLVEAVTRLHGGEMALEDNAPGLRVVMMLTPQPA